MGDRPRKRPVSDAFDGFGVTAASLSSMLSVPLALSPRPGLGGIGKDDRIPPPPKRSSQWETEAQGDLEEAEGNGIRGPELAYGPRVQRVEGGVDARASCLRRAGRGKGSSSRARGPYAGLPNKPTGPPPPILPARPTRAATDACRHCARALVPNRSTLEPAPGRRCTPGY